MSLRRLNRTIKPLAERKPNSINLHIIKVETKGNKECSLHATKGWRERSVEAKA